MHITVSVVTQPPVGNGYIVDDRFVQYVLVRLLNIHCTLSELAGYALRIDLLLVNDVEYSLYAEVTGATFFILFRKIVGRFLFLGKDVQF